MTVTIIDNMGYPIPGVNVYESNPDGTVISGGFYTSSNVSGQAIIGDVPGYITFSFVGLEKKTFAAGSIPETVTLNSDNELAPVTITAEPLFPWGTAILVATIAIAALGLLYKFKPSLFKF